MAELVGIYAASHGPLIAREWPRLPGDLRRRLADAYGVLGRRLTDAGTEVLITIAPDHWTNFFLDNLPTVCIGVGASHEGPPEPFLADFPHKTLMGDTGVADHLLRTALARDFEPSISHRLRLDHGICLPLRRMELAVMPRIVPVLVNGLEPPMLSYRRCLAWGRLLAEAIRSYPGVARIAILATGGLSHSIGEPSMGRIDEAFDVSCIEALAHGEAAPLVALLEEGVEQAGNGAHEIRNWLFAHGAAGERGFELIDYIPAPEVYLGCAFAAWRI